MKLGLGSLAAMLALGAGLMLAAAPSVTMAQAAEAVRAKRLVRYKSPAVALPEARARIAIYTCEDLTRQRIVYAKCFEEEGGHVWAQYLFAFDGNAKRILLLNRVPAGVGQALGSGPPPAEQQHFGPTATVGIIPKAKLVAALSQAGWVERLAGVTLVGGQELGPKEWIGNQFAQKPLLNRIKALAESKASVTTRVQLDGKPAVKIVGTEEGREITVWLDPATKLPVRVERPHPHSPDKHITVESGFEWDFALPAGLTLDALFSTEPPPGVPLTLVVE